jgi:Mor family transcriptional regulator
MITADDILSDISAVAYQAILVTHGECLALASARAVVDCLYLNFRRQYIYVPTPSRQGWQDRHDRIWQEFNGRNHAELAAKYRVSTQWVYQVVKHMRQEQIKTRQADLFPLPETGDTRQTLMAVLQDYLPADLRRAGLSDSESDAVASVVALRLTERYPGISFKISAELWRQRRGDETGDLFDQAG